MQRKRPKIGSYKKKSGPDAARDAAEKYKQRKCMVLTTTMDDLFGNALGTLCTDEDVTPRSKESSRKGEEALKWIMHGFEGAYIARNTSHSRIRRSRYGQDPEALGEHGYGLVHPMRHDAQSMANYYQPDFTQME